VFQTIYSATPVKYSIGFYTEFRFMNFILTHTNPGRKADDVQHWVPTETIWAKQGAVKMRNEGGHDLYPSSNSTIGG
jgi:hypothetical protein